MQVVTGTEMRAIEQRAADSGASLNDVMANAGHAVAREVSARARGGSVLFLVGPGNNGGDGLIAAQELSRLGHDVHVYSYRRRPGDDDVPDTIGAEDDQSREKLTRLATSSRIIVDALLGIGQSRPPDAQLESILAVVNEPLHAWRLAVDIPTGVFADTGDVPARAFRADKTLAMAVLKVGNVVFPGAEWCGEVEVIDVGIPLDRTRVEPIELVESGTVAEMLPTRKLNGSKGSSGRLFIVAGSRDFLGAPVLCSLAAYRAGAGLIEIGLPESAQAPVAAHAVEPIFKVLPEENGQLSPGALPHILAAAQQARAVAYGPGLGLSDQTVELTADLLPRFSSDERRPLVVDADGLNALSRIPRWWTSDLDLVVTPHPGEMARLTGLSIAEIQRDRVGVARRYAQKWKVVVVLKGAGTIVATPDGRVFVNPTGGPNLATAGTGDVLTGTIAGLVAQGMSTEEAAVAGVYLHGLAGDLAAQTLGEVGTVASDLLPLIPKARLAIMTRKDDT